MKIIGLIAEFNPFHNGHSYLIKQIKQKYQADIIVCVMSGHFLQRGEPAIIDKWARATIACLNGIDIVIELPYVASVQPAEIFAQEAIKILNHCQITHLAFGCEDDDLLRLHQQTQLIHQSQIKIYQQMKQGDNYAQATKKVLPNINLSPNRILALAYIKAINNINTNIQPIAIKRLASNYHDILPKHDTIASATAIRQLLFNDQDVSNYLPSLGYSIFTKQIKRWSEDYWQALKVILARTSAQELSQIYDIREGLEHRLLNHWQQATSFEHFISLIKTKRYSAPRMQRCCCHILTNTTKQLFNQHLQEHFQVLALSTLGRQHLKKLNTSQSDVKFHTTINKKNSAYFEHDIRVTSIYSAPNYHQLNDFTQQTFIKNDSVDN